MRKHVSQTALIRARQDDSVFKACLGYVGKPCLKQNSQNKKCISNVPKHTKHRWEVTGKKEILYVSLSITKQLVEAEEFFPSLCTRHSTLVLGYFLILRSSCLLRWIRLSAAGAKDLQGCLLVRSTAPGLWNYVACLSQSTQGRD